MDQPLDPFPKPTFLAHLPSLGISSHTVAGALFALVLFFWALYTIVAIYHWVRYSHAALIALPAVATHLIVSAILILFAYSGVLAA